MKTNTLKYTVVKSFREKGNGRFYDIGHGCIHEEILKASPKLKMFVDLHLYPVETGYYFLQKDKKQAKEYLRVTDEELEFLAKCEDKDYFKYQLFALGIVERWQEESRKAIQALEELTGDVWVNPYKESEERHRLVLSDEEREEIEGKNEVIKTFEKRINKATKEKDVKSGLLSDNYIYYV